MKILDLLSISIKNLMRRKVRMSLTLLGIVLGAMAVSITLSIGAAIKSNNKKILESKGNLQVIQVNINDNSNKSKKNKDKVYLDDAAIHKLRNIDGVEGLWGVIRLNNIMFKVGKGNIYSRWNPLICGVLMEDIEKFGYNLLEGTKPNNVDLDKKKRIQVLAGQYFEYSFVNTRFDWPKNSRMRNSPVEKYYHDLYNSDTKFVLKKPFVTYGLDKMVLEIPINKDVKSNDIEVFDLITMRSDTYKDDSNNSEYEHYDIEITGRLNWDKVKESSDWNLFQNCSYGALIDVNMAKDIVNQYRRINNIKISEKDKDEPLFTYQDVKVKVSDISRVEEVTNKIGQLGFEPKNQIEEVQKEEKRTKSLQLILGTLGVITLFVSSLSVANTMITSMYERTNEIGVMKVLGCKISNIKWMFMLESLMLGLFGGVIGMSITNVISNFMNKIAGVNDTDKLKGVAKLLATFMNSMRYDSGKNIKLDIAIVSPKLWLYVIIGAIVITIVAGYFPAKRASRISALSAIKDE